MKALRKRPDEPWKVIDAKNTIDFSNAAGDAEIMKHLEMTPLEMVACYIIADHYGLRAQLGQTMEECAELIQACNKYLRCEYGGQPAGTDSENIKRQITEEIADVEVMIWQLKWLLCITDRQVGDIQQAKLEREMERIDSADEH